MTVAGGTLRYRRPGTRCGRPRRRTRTGARLIAGPINAFEIEVITRTFPSRGLKPLRPH